MTTDKELLRAAIKRSYGTAAKFAAELGVSESTMSRYINGKMSIPEDKMELIRKLLETDSESVFLEGINPARSLRVHIDPTLGLTIVARWKTADEAAEIIRLLKKQISLLEEMLET